METQNVEQKSLFEREVSPQVQLYYILGATLVCQILVYLININRSHTETFLLRSYYTTSLAFVLVYALFNSVLSLSAKDSNKYWSYSIACYVILVVVGVSSAYFLSGISLDEAGAFRWMYSVFTFGYLLFLSLIRVMKKIVFLAQKQDKRLRGE